VSSFSCADPDGRWPLTSDPVSGARARAFKVETAAMIAAATIVRKSVRVGPVAAFTMQQRGEVQSRGPDGDAKPQCHLLDDVR
jgi:hypothetical protein